METWGKWTFGGNGYPSALKEYIPSALIFQCPFPPNVCKWALGQMGTWKKWTFAGKEYPKCLKGYPKCLMPITPKCLKMGSEANGHLGQMDIRGRSIPSVLYPSPIFFSNRQLGPQVLIYPTAHFTLMSIWEKWAQLR